MQRDELVSPELARALRPWFSGITRGPRPIVHDPPAILEPPDHGTVLAWRVGSADPYDIVILGPRTRARYFVDRPGRDCLQLRFRPGRAAEFLNLPLRDLADRAVAAPDLARSSWQALNRLIVPESHQARLRLLARALPVAPSASGDRDGSRRRLVAAATAMLAADGGAQGARVGAVARRLNVSERHLRAVFLDGTGLTPSRFMHIDRIRLVLARIGQKLPEVATGAGYYDQSHMGADFRRVMSATPHAFASRHWPAVETCTADTG